MEDIEDLSDEELLMHYDELLELLSVAHKDFKLYTDEKRKRGL